MPRPRKCRRVCRLPQSAAFAPVDPETLENPVMLTVDEFETLRLIDAQGLSQEECSVYMEVARTTVQQIYLSARQKLAAALVEGRGFLITGGEYALCDGQSPCCHASGCWRRLHDPSAIRCKTGGPMMIALPLDEDRKSICPSFARAPFYLFHDPDSGHEEILDNPAAQAEGGAGLQAVQFLLDQGAAVILTPRCGENAAQVLHAADAAIYKTEGTDAAENLRAYGEGKLSVLTRFHAGYQGIR